MTDFTNLKADNQMRAPRLTVYGTPGIGKSTFAAQAPNVVFFDLEDGLDGIEVAKVRINTFAELLENITALATQDHTFQTLAIDTLSQVQALIYEAVCLQQNVKNIEDCGYGKGYTYAASMWHQFLEWLTALRNTKGMTIILLGHEEVKKFADPMGDSYDYYTIKLRESYAAMVHEWSDGLFFAKQKTFTKKEDAGMNKKIAKAVDGGRVLYTAEQPSFLAKSRTSLALPPELPLAWDSFVKAIGTNKQQ
jgi:hypothetical protein